MSNSLIKDADSGVQRDFLLYWRPDSVDESRAHRPLLRHAGGNQLEAASVGDTLWISTVRDGDLFVAGRLKIGECTDWKGAKQRLGSKDVRDSGFHVIAADGTIETLSNMSVAHVVSEMRFEGANDRFVLLEGKIDPEQLQPMRELAPSSAALLDNLWTQYRAGGKGQKTGQRGGLRKNTGKNGDKQPLSAERILESLGDELDQVADATKAPWIAYLNKEAYRLLKENDPELFYTNEGHEYLRAWEDLTVPFIIHMRVEMDDRIPNTPPNYGCRREVDRDVDPATVAQNIAAYLQQLSMKNPGDSQAHFILGVALSDAGRLQEATEAYRSALAVYPGMIGAHYNLGSTYLAMGEHQQAIEQLHKTTKLAPEFAQAHFMLGAALMALGSHSLGIKATKRGLEISPNDPGAHSNIGHAFKELGDYEAAIPWLQKAVNVVPASADAYYEIGRVYQRLGRFEDEFSSYFKALEIRKDYVQALFALGVAYARLKRGDQARVVSKAPPPDMDLNDGETIYYVALAYLALGDLHLARKWRNSLRDIDPRLADELEPYVLERGQGGESETAQTESELKWSEADQNPFGIRVLDCTSFSANMLSTTADEKTAASFLALRNSTGLQHRGHSPERVVRFQCRLKYSPLETPVEGALFTASQMEDKWDIYFYDGYLYFARSWTGLLAFRAWAVFRDGGLVIDLVEADGEDTPQDKTYATRAVDFLIKSHLLRGLVPHPIPGSIESDPEQIALFSFSNFGRWARYASYEDTLPCRAQEAFSPQSLPLVGLDDAAVSPDELKVDDEAVSPAESKVDDEVFSPAELKVIDAAFSPAELKVDEEAVSPAESKVDDEVFSPAELKVIDAAFSPAESKVDDEVFSPAELKVDEEAVSPAESKVDDEVFSPAELKVIDAAFSPAELKVDDEVFSPAELKVDDEAVSPAELKVDDAVTVAVEDTGFLASPTTTIDPPVTPIAAPRKRRAIRVSIGGQQFQAPTIPQLYQQALAFLYRGGYIGKLSLPVVSGPKRYLLSTSPQHRGGNPFVTPVEYGGFYMEAHKSRSAALTDLERLIKQCGLTFEREDAGEPDASEPIAVDYVSDSASAESSDFGESSEESNNPVENVVLLEESEVSLTTEQAEIPVEDKSDWAIAKEALAKAQRVFVLTGAGVSAESNVPTFRGSDGAPVWRGMPFEELSSAQTVQDNLPLVWEWFDYRRSVVADCRPNAGHTALAACDLSGRFDEFTLVTQNVDGLHAAAGSTGIIELHGNIWRARCLTCHALRDMREVPTNERPPVCVECGHLMRPDIVLFGESLPEGVFEEAHGYAKKCDVCLLIGTSALVTPAAKLPEAALQAGKFVIEINPETTAFSSRCNVSLRGLAGEILPLLLPSDGRELVLKVAAEGGGMVIYRKRDDGGAWKYSARDSSMGFDEEGKEGVNTRHDVGDTLEGALTSVEMSDETLVLLYPVKIHPEYLRAVRDIIERIARNASEEFQEDRWTQESLDRWREMTEPSAPREKAKGGTYTLGSGRTVSLAKVSLGHTYASLLEGTVETASRLIRQDLSRRVAEAMRPGTPLLIVDDLTKVLARFQWIAHFESSSGAQTDDLDYHSRLYVCWFTDDISDHFNSLIGKVLSSIDWEASAEDYDWTNA